MESERNSGSSCSNNNNNIVEVVDKLEQEVMLPGFRFHPTDEELVGFYLKRKIQQRPLSIELIKQLDIYKHDPWDLPKMATTGEKEWYFFCPRDRKYRNSARPNRVTGAGFWKATGTDRPIYSSEGNKCIGLKKSLVFYKGRAAKGMKTDWMMHEFRLPSLADGNHQHPTSSAPTAASKRFIDRTIPANDAWAICRIFKKTGSMAQRALSHSWVSPLAQEVVLPTSSDEHILSRGSLSQQPSHCFSQIQNLPLRSTTTTTPSFPTIHHQYFNYNNNITTSNTLDHQIHHSSPPNINFSSLDFYSYKPINNIPLAPKPSYHPHTTYPFSTMGDQESSANFSSPFTTPPSTGKCKLDLSAMLLNMSSSSSSSILLGDFKQQAGGDHESMSSVDQFSSGSHHSNGNGGGGGNSSHGIMQVGGWMQRSDDLVHGDHHNPPSIMMMRSPNFDALPFSYLGDGVTPTTPAWKQNLLLWDDANSSPPCPSNCDQVASTLSTTKCYT